MISKKIIYGCEERGDFEKPYLVRWELFRNKMNTFAVYFHKFIRSDADDLHDHPWNFITFILWRGYYEETFDTTRIIKRVWPLTIYYRPATHLHRVVLINDKPAYTLVFRFKYVRYWGFVTKGKWQIFTEYFKKMGC